MATTMIHMNCKKASSHAITSMQTSGAWFFSGPTQSASQEVDALPYPSPSKLEDVDSLCEDQSVGQNELDSSLNKLNQNQGQPLTSEIDVETPGRDDNPMMLTKSNF